MKNKIVFLGLLILMVSACSSGSSDLQEFNQQTALFSTPQGEQTSTEEFPAVNITPIPTRTQFAPGELVEYIAQSGDTLYALSVRFNTSIDEILAANTFIPPDVTTLPDGMPMQIPIYYRPYWGEPFKILPDSEYVNGPSAIDFDTSAFVNQYDGWLKDYTEYASRANRTGAEIVDLVSQNFSINPKLLLAVIEYHAGGLSNTSKSSVDESYPLGYKKLSNKGLYMQLVWVANELNNSYYGWRTGKLYEFEQADLRIVRPDPWMNAATVTLQHYFAQNYSVAAFEQAISPDGFFGLYADLFGNPWPDYIPHMPGSLTQPEFRLPIPQGHSWSYTGGPHTGWGKGLPFAALDFAPFSDQPGCYSTEEWALAVADGLVVRSENGSVELDLDGDGDSRTGWVVYYLHLAAAGRPPVGTYLKAGDPIGHPSCEGGTSTGTHIHIARKYNGEWVEAAGIIPFNMEGWIPQEGVEAYAGTLVRYGEIVTACVCGNAGTVITSEIP